ncbi:MAG TPA: zinc dependent phospholipase C family protein [Pyrinomonadaceae bacterium]|nr:zinc dependent phospholipase C family protein [Pyrinomonadaceae bacterium]
MPGPYIHISAMRHALQGLASGKFRPVGSKRINPKWAGEDVVALGSLLDRHPNFASLGAIGPDLFFFLPDFRDSHGIPVSSVLVAVLNFLEGLYDALDPYISKYEHYLGPISEDTAEEMSRLTGGLSETVGDIAGELSSILITALEDFLIKQKDFLEFFSLGLNKGYDEQAYFWSDMLHYRSTGAFGRALWQNAVASDSDGARAYALGYLTHLGTDVTGHALVNTIAGGPFRVHWQRHHLVENHMDAYWYLLDPAPGVPRSFPGYSQLTESALYFDIAFKADSGDPVIRPGFPAGNTLRDNYIRRRKLDLDSDLADPLADIITQSMIDVFYQDGKHPKILRDNNGRPSTDLVAEAYRLLFRFLKFTTVDGFSHEPPPPPDVFPNLDFPTLSDPSDEPPGDDDGGSFWDDLLDFLLSIIAILTYIVEVAVYLATLPWAILADLVTYPLRLGLYYALELPLFHLLKNFRSVLVMSGYMLPMQDEIVQPLIRVGNPDRVTWQQVRDELGDIFGGTLPPQPPDERVTFRDRLYPHSHPEDEFRHPWDYPTSVPELPLTTAGPFARDAGPPTLFAGTNPDANIRDGLEFANTPTEADNVNFNLTPFRHLGDSVAFSQYLIWLATRTDPHAAPLVDWNLDADRGYGYHCWDWNRHPKDAAFPPQPDPEGNLYEQPCTWPSQADHDEAPAAPLAWNPAIPLKTHWADEPDPGCQDQGGPGAPPPTHGAARKSTRGGRTTRRRRR